MQVVYFQHKVIKITVTIGHAFDNLDMVINSFDLGSGDGEVEVVKYPGYMPAHLSGETGKLYYPGAESFVDPVIEEPLSLASGR